ncbi:ABC transporter ATP-binding protein [Kaarinaea lacus]
MNDASLIKVENLTRLYGPHVAVDNLNFEVHRGEVLGFLGPNGAGKSTTMRMITGNLAPSHGRIMINGIDLLDQPKLAKAEIGFLPEQPPLYTELTVDEFLRFCARLNRIPRDRQGKAIDTVKMRCGLGEVSGRLISNLSKGFQQRVGIAQAIIHSPAIVILDEPTVGLDPIQIREIRHLIRELGGDHSVILSTHILPEVQATCDRVQIIHQGRLVLTDSIDGLTQKMQSSSMLVRFSQPYIESSLLTIESVRSVEQLGDHYCRVHHEPETSPASAIAEVAVSQGWGLQELTPERRSLEEIFVDITTTEVDATTADSSEAA